MVISYNLAPYIITVANLIPDPENIFTNLSMMGRIFIGLAIIGIALFGYFVLTRGVSYYLIECNAYITFCVLVQCRLKNSLLTNMETHIGNLKIVVVCYFVGIAWSVVWLIILKRKRTTIYECTTEKRHS